MAIEGLGCAPRTRALVWPREFSLTIVTPSAAPPYRHFILTRFWFSKTPRGSDALASDPHEWLEHRLKLFRSYCLPSVVGQSCQDFRWFICFDVRAPGEFVAKMRELTAPSNNIEILTLNEWYVPSHISPWKGLPPRKSEIIENIIARADGAGWVLTTRLDSDDGLHRDFVKRLSQAIDENKQQFLNFPNGIIFNKGKSYLYHHQSNAFISLFEPLGGMKTVLCALHERVNEVGLPIRQLSPVPAFLQVVHGTNDSNKIRGYRVPKILALQGFESVRALYDAPLEESDVEILLSNAFLGPFRSGRDRLVNQAKRIYDYLQKRGHVPAA